MGVWSIACPATWREIGVYGRLPAEWSLDVAHIPMRRVYGRLPTLRITVRSRWVYGRLPALLRGLGAWSVACPMVADRSPLLHGLF